MVTETLYLFRTDYTEHTTFGKLYHDDKFLCYTLEPSPFANHPCISIGTYPIFKNYPSSHFGLVPCVRVPERSGILIHCGNFYTNTLGCILVGMSYSKKNGHYYITDSKKALDCLTHYLNAHPNPFNIKVISQN